MSMNVPLILMVVLTYAQTQLDPITVVAGVDTDWMKTSMTVKV